jgi:hypothetical protein
MKSLNAVECQLKTIEELEAELKQSQADAERWHLLYQRAEALCDEWDRSCQSWMKLYEDVQRLRQENPSADLLAEGSEFHQWFLRNMN